MKKIFIALTALAVLFSCSKEKENETPEVDDEKGTEEEVGSVTFNAILPETKTTLGDKNGNVWPNYWSAGDKISVNGVASNALDESAAGKASAEFTVDNVAAPYYAAYPASALSAYKAGSATITIPSTQKYVAGSYDPAAYVMLASGNNSELSFTSKVAIFKLTPTGEKSIISVRLTSIGSDKIAGAFTTNFSTITPATGAVSTVSVSSSTPVAAGTPWFIVVPAVDFSANGVDILITDSEGGSMVHHCSPAKAWEAGKLYSEEVAYVPAVSDITISAEGIGITSSTAIICLPEASYAADALTFSVYSDAGCATLVDSYAVPEGNTCWGGEAPRFCISGLSPGNTYYVKVTDETSSKFSNVLPVTTAEFTIVEVSSNPASVGDVILAEDFGELRWDSELINKGVGFFPISQESFANTEVANDEDSKFLPIDTNIEKVLSGQGAALEFSRLAHWAQGANPNLYIHPGYIKIVGSKKVTHIVTPALESIPEGMVATLDVEITASAYFSESSDAYATTSAIVAVQPAGEYNELVDESKTNTLDLTSNIQPITLDEATAWKTYKVTLTGVGKGARLAFGAASDVTGNNARMNISDMKVTITSLEEPGLLASLKRVSSSSAVFTWTYGGDAAVDIAKPYTAGIYRDPSCTDLVVSFNFPANTTSEDEGPKFWSGKTPCFVFGGLAPSTEYWFQVQDTENGAKSSPVSVTTEAFTVVEAGEVSDAAVGDVILAEDFSEISSCSDELAGAAGFVPSDHVLMIPSGNNPEGGFVEYGNTGNRIFGSGWDISDSRMDHGWGFFGNSSCFSRNGYLRVSSSTGRTHIVTPALSGIPEGKLATIEVTVTATKYESSTNDVAVFLEKGLTMSSQTTTSEADYKKYDKAALSDGYALGISSVKSWTTKSVTIPKVDSDCQLLIGSLDAEKTRFYFDDIVVKIVELKDKGAVDATIEINDFDSFKEFLAACEPGVSIKGNLNADIALSASQADEIDALYPIDEFDGIVNGNSHTISGLTKPLFGKLSGSVSNLTLNSTLNISDEMENIGILASSAKDATISGCVSMGSVTSSVSDEVDGDIALGGLVGSISGCTLTACQNNATVTNNTAASGTACIGGLIGVSKGANTLTGTSSEYNYNQGTILDDSASLNVAIGGICGYSSNSASDFAYAHNLSTRDYGDITIQNNTKNKIYVGGILGKSAVTSSFNYANNAGKILFKDLKLSSTGQVFAGGIIGGWTDSGTQTINGCINSGCIECDSSDYGDFELADSDNPTPLWSFFGGISGMGGNTNEGLNGGYNSITGKTFTNCTNTGYIWLYTKMRCCVGGVVAYTENDPDGCVCTANITSIKKKAADGGGIGTVGNNYHRQITGGVVGLCTASSVTNAKYNGTLSTFGSSPQSYDGGIIGYIYKHNSAGTSITLNNCKVGGSVRSTSTGAAALMCWSAKDNEINFTFNNCVIKKGTLSYSTGSKATINSDSDVTKAHCLGGDSGKATVTNDVLPSVVDSID